MNISANSVEGSIKDYFKMGAKNVWDHQVVYLLPLLLLLPICGVLNMMVSPVEKVLMFFVGIFFAVFYMEITFTTTQEKYTPKKYLTSFMVAIMGSIGFIKRHAIMLFILISISFGINLFMLEGKDVTPDTAMLAFIKGIFANSGTQALYDMAFFGYLLKEVLSDYFVAERMTGFSGVTPTNLTEDAIHKNKDILKKMLWIGVFFSLLSPVLMGLQSILFIIMIAGLTFYSMEVFGVDTGKKARALAEEREMQEMKNLVPIPIQK